MDGLVNLLVVLALMYVLIKIPFWILGPLRVSSGRSLIGGLARAYVMGRALGAVAGHSTGRGAGRRGGQAGAARSGAARSTARPRANAAADPPWPAPIREWGGMDGIYSPEAIGRRLHAQQAGERSRAGATSGVEQPQFLQPSPQVPTHDLATGHATTAPAGIEFRAANGAVSTPSGQPVPPPRHRYRGRAPRRYPPFSTPGAPTARRPVPAPPPPMRVAPVPPELRFQTATPAPRSTPVRASGPPQPPVFQPATRDRGAAGRRARTHTPAPVQFIAPRPPAPPAPPSPSPSVSTPAADAAPPPRTRPTRGGDPR
jgi:hypothetical protein